MDLKTQAIIKDIKTEINSKIDDKVEDSFYYLKEFSFLIKLTQSTGLEKAWDFVQTFYENERNYIKASKELDLFNSMTYCTDKLVNLNEKRFLSVCTEITAFLIDIIKSQTSQTTGNYNIQTSYPLYQS